MPANKTKAQTFVREMQKTEHELLRRLELDRNDVTVRISVNVIDRVTYNNHEDED